MPLSKKCQITNIIYKAKITSNLRNYHEKVYYRTSESKFNQRYGNHKKSFNHKKRRTDTELSKEYWRLKKLKAKPQVKFYILKRCKPTKRTGTCYFCLNEKFFITEHQGSYLLNQRIDFMSKCRHKNKVKLMNYKTWPLCGTFLCLEFFSGAIFSRIQTDYGDLQSKSLHSPRV